MNDPTGTCAANVSPPQTIQISPALSRAAELLAGAVAPGELVAVAQALAHIAPVLWGHHKQGAGHQAWLSNAKPISIVDVARDSLGIPVAR